MPPLLSYNGSRPIWHHHALFTNLLRYTRPPFLRPSDASGKIFVTVHFTFFCGIRTLAPLTLLLHLPQSCSNFIDVPCVPCNILTDCIHVFYPPPYGRLPSPSLIQASTHPIAAYTHVPPRTSSLPLGRLGSLTTARSRQRHSFVDPSSSCFSPNSVCYPVFYLALVSTLYTFRNVLLI